VVRIFNELRDDVCCGLEMTLLAENLKVVGEQNQLRANHLRNRSWLYPLHESNPWSCHRSRMTNRASNMYEERTSTPLSCLSLLGLLLSLDSLQSQGIRGTGSASL